MRRIVAGSVCLGWLLIACGRSNLEDMLFDEGAGAAGGLGAAGTSGKGSGGNGAGGQTGMSGASMGGGIAAGASAGLPGMAGFPNGGVAGNDAGVPPPLNCGDGKLDPGEACDLGSGNQSLPALQIRQGGLSADVTPYVTDGSVQTFYSYSSASSHTGFEQQAAGRLLLHRSRFDQALTLVMHHGLDMSQPPSRVFFTITGLPNTSVVAVSDDAGEVQKTTATTVTGDWRFNSNSDGGAVGGLPFPGNWTITVTPSFIAGIDSWAFVDGSGSLIGLDLSTPVDIIANDAASACRPDCSIPRCGDGILDGGE
ncbi:MAG TPA: hypothetical protein VGP93_08560, partial [Polyangiaceae bacterium]|nr:hypothetical protein [Polyangiaceae bacterium]